MATLRLAHAVAKRSVMSLLQPRPGLNGACLVAPNVLLAAGAKDLIWRVDLSEDGGAVARPWLIHDSMKNRPGEKKPEQPGTNGVQFAARSNHLYYNTTSLQMLLRVKVDAATHAPAGCPEFVAPDGAREGRTIIAGACFTDTLVGPSAAAWGRAPGDYGRIAYVTTDGGTASPPQGPSRFDPMTESEWTLPRAAAWCVCRSRRRPRPVESGAQWVAKMGAMGAAAKAKVPCSLEI
jgi:hypothetical protein